MKVRFKNSVAMSVIIFATVMFFIFALIVFIDVNEDRELVVELPDRGMVYRKMDVDVVWSDDRSCHITQKIDVQFLDNNDGYGSHGIYVDIPVNSGEKVRGVWVIASGKYLRGVNPNENVSAVRLPYSVDHAADNKLVRVQIGDPDRVFYQGGVLNCTVEYDYITPEHPDGANLLDINAIGYGWRSTVADATVRVTYPVAPTGGIKVYTGRQSMLMTASSDIISVSDDGKTVTVAAGKLDAFSGVRVISEMPDGLLHDRGMDAFSIFAISIGIALTVAVIAVMLFFGKDKPVTPIVDFYPPRIDGKGGRKRHMLPVQMGVLIDDICSAQDVTSLIFYWASEGYLSIEEKDGETYFKKLNEVDAVTQYEKTLFDKLFESGKNVSLSSLEGNFGDSIASAKHAASSEYKGKLYTRQSVLMSYATIVICCIYALVFSLFCSLRLNAVFDFELINIIGLTVLIPILITYVCSTLIMKYYIKLKTGMRRFLLIATIIVSALLSVGIMLLLPADMFGWTEKIVYALSISLVSVLSPFITRRTDFYNNQLDNIVGFRNFLRDAEKDRLEILLESDPQYYYNILPYANVLGVSSIWSNKFKGITIEPPSYYSGGTHVSVFDIYIMNRLSRSVGSSLSDVKPSASHSGWSGGSFSGGSHGGGGGHGGFGGGGGGRW